eukprot:gnl/TRDRNA2_/TRDRNA2_186186_c0_seq1.p1 gnl/TRDRNA2_/TRDRNA2_186186_c0~~gnl/TRDRNA2_/TRDRNA2_186186_c0_seq1.p1  ORF type:complete len:228 (-),score=24.58 gnl/TRDRNA2_/TRDRNA2_186186_c0_seq1:87-770(-)
MHLLLRLLILCAACATGHLHVSTRRVQRIRSLATPISRPEAVADKREATHMVKTALRTSELSAMAARVRVGRSEHAANNSNISAGDVVSGSRQANATAPGTNVSVASDAVKAHGEGQTTTAAPSSMISQMTALSPPSMVVYGTMLLLRMGGFLVEPDDTKEEGPEIDTEDVPKESPTSEKYKEPKTFLGLPKIFWVLVCVVIAMAIFLSCIPIILTIAKRRRPRYSN